MNKVWTLIFLFAPFVVLGQEDRLEDSHVEPNYAQFQHLHHRTQIDQSKFYFEDQKRVHSGVKPMLLFVESKSDNPRLFLERAWSGKKQEGKSNYFKFYPIADISGGAEVGSAFSPNFAGGLGLGMDYSSAKFIFTFKGMPYYSSSGYFRDSLQTNFDMDVGTDRSLANSLFYRAELYAAYKANKFFTLIGGYGKNFFGEGYRSLLLSDNIGAHPFFKIETSFAGIKYVNLYNFWRDNTSDPFDRSSDIPKFSSTHYLSWNITRAINLSVFEAVVFQANDTLVNRGFDFNYINPVVFYRPAEYGLGSSDNVLLGTSFSYKLNKHHNFYAQFILDEFLLSEIIDRSRWWANKYGWQAGYKSNHFLVENLYFQLEFNGIRPYTYSHKFSQHAYGHLNAPAAHPLGSNFMELLNVTSYKTGKHRLTNKFIFNSHGMDNSDTLSFGQNIFTSYTLRPGDYDQLLFQGVRNNVLNESLIYEYELVPEIDLFLMAAYNWRMVNTSTRTDHYHTFSVGLKSRIWNSYSDF